MSGMNNSNFLQPFLSLKNPMGTTKMSGIINSIISGMAGIG
jgi:hypothetical protein